MTLTLAPKAISDLENAFAYIHADNPLAAQNLKTALNQCFTRLEARPHIGRLARTRTYREWSVKGWPYLIVYRMDGGDIEILRIWHTRRDRAQRP